MDLKMAEEFFNHGIAVTVAPTCYLSGEEGAVVYSGLRDTIYGAPGVWNIRKSSNLLFYWLDPRPKQEELIKLYAGYHTHSKTNLSSMRGIKSLKWTCFSCHDFADNQVRLQLFALAYNLVNFLPRLAQPRSISHWSLRTLQTKLINIGAKVVRHARYTCFQMAEVSISRNLFAAILRRIRRLIQPAPM